MVVVTFRTFLSAGLERDKWSLYEDDRRRINATYMDVFLFPEFAGSNPAEAVRFLRV
jgi:hypothetical protein